MLGATDLKNLPNPFHCPLSIMGITRYDVCSLSSSLRCIVKWCLLLFCYRIPSEYIPHYCGCRIMPANGYLSREDGNLNLVQSIQTVKISPQCINWPNYTIHFQLLLFSAFSTFIFCYKLLYSRKFGSVSLFVEIILK